MTLKELVMGTVSFTHYVDGNLWYATSVGNFAFPVPITDIGNTTFLATDKGMLFMRYIRKQLALLEEAKEAAHG